MALTRNPFKVSVEDFPNGQNEDEGIQEEFLDMIRLSRPPSKMKAWKISGE